MATSTNREIYLNRIKDTDKRNRKRVELEQSDLKVEKMRTRLKVYFDDLGLEQSMDALGYMCEKHGETLHKNGELYIVHPLSMACRFQSLKIPDDDLFATILLHDVIEETAPLNRTLLSSEVNRAVEDLPAGPVVKEAVNLMTVSAIYSGEKKSDIKSRYYERFIESDRIENKIALKCKGFDRWDNITTMTALSKRAVLKNVLETSILLLPVLKTAKAKWPRESNILFLLRTVIKETNDILAFYNGIEDMDDREELIRLLDDENYLRGLR